MSKENNSNPNPFDRHSNVPSKNSTSSFFDLVPKSKPTSPPDRRTVSRKDEPRKISAADFMNQQSTKSSSATFTSSVPSTRKLYEDTKSIQQQPYQPVSMQTVTNASNLQSKLQNIKSYNATKEQTQKLSKPQAFTPYNQTAVKPRVKEEKMTNDKSKSGEKDRKIKDVEDKPKLSTEQVHVLDLILKQKQSVFFTGNAGTGKSFLLREIIRELKKVTQSDKLAITASTGIAACNIGGTTLHSFAGVGLAVGPKEGLATKAAQNKRTKQRWSNVQVLIVDEISMVDGLFFDNLEYIGRTLRGSSKPFGGIQLVLCGDFMQLPPVSKSAPNFAFESKMWSKCIKTTFQLTHVFRQKDQSFIKILNEMRIGQMSIESVKQLEKLARPLLFNDGIEPTQLFSLRDQVDRANTSRLAMIKGESTRFTATDVNCVDAMDVKKLRDSCMAPDILELKIGAQVMLIKNQQDGLLVNGSLGTVLGFTEKTRMPIVKFLTIDGRTMETPVEKQEWSVEITAQARTITRIQIPLILAYAMTVHKAQGQTIVRLKVDISKVFECGQAYVALSRAISMEGLQVVGFAKEKVKCSQKVLEFHKMLDEIPNEVVNKWDAMMDDE